MAKKKNNPNGANQYLADPRQSLFLSYYLNPKSKTFSNGLQSALKAGFTQEYAESLTAQMPKWLSEGLGDSRMLEKAQRNLDEFLDVDVTQQALGAFGPLFNKETKEPVMVRNPKIMALKLDASKFVAERLGRKKYGKDGEENPPGSTVNNITQIIINPPDGRKNVDNRPDTEAVLGVAGVE